MHNFNVVLLKTIFRRAEEYMGSKGKVSVDLLGTGSVFCKICVRVYGGGARVRRSLVLEVKLFIAFSRRT